MSSGGLTSQYQRLDAPIIVDSPPDHARIRAHLVPDVPVGMPGISREGEERVAAIRVVHLADHPVRAKEAPNFELWGGIGAPKLVTRRAFDSRCIS